ncbi:glycosyltransferase family 4 protein [Altericista sp. CCNU0014]|uniref:glycosyltransferase family 4 protein n=1 Tax=Altericista sp. CCNU0014 TaxID=3082949 RepID=UPI0038515A16
MQKTSIVRSPKFESPQSKSSSFVTPRRSVPLRQSIALISEHGDPAADIGCEEAGGQNVYVRQVGEALARLGWQVDMFTRKTRATDAAIVQHGPHCRTIRLKAGPEQFVPRDLLFQYMPDFADALLKFQAKDSGNYPLFHSNYWMSGWVGLQLKQASNIQLVHTYHSLGAVKYQNLARPPVADTRLATERQILERADCVVATSPQEREHLRSLVSRGGYVEVIPCGTDVETFHRMPQLDARASLGFDAGQKVVLYVGRFDPRKGIETLVRAFAALYERSEDSLKSQLRLAIVGGCQIGQADAEERSRIEALVAELGIAERTTFAGQVGHDRLPLYYTAADVCVIPSHYEPFGLVAIEAMACGTPVIASDVGGLKFTVVPNETGLLALPQDVQGFATAIEQVLTQARWSTQAKDRATTWVRQNFSWTGVAAQLSDLYRRLLVGSLTERSVSELVESTIDREPLRLSA